MINFIQTRILITHHSCRRARHRTTPRKAVSVPLAQCDRRDSWLRKLKSGPRRRRYASEHVRTVSPRMSVIQTKTGSKKPWPSSSARGCAHWSMATKSLSILGKTAVGNVRLAMKLGRAGTMTHDYKRDDHAVRRSERSRRCSLHL